MGTFLLSSIGDIFMESRHVEQTVVDTLSVRTYTLTLRVSNKLDGSREKLLCEKTGATPDLALT